MTGKGLKRLNRKELLKMLVEQGREVERLQRELDEAQQKLSDREIRIQKAGTLAEAAFSLNGVYEAAEAAAKQYQVPDTSIFVMGDHRSTSVDSRSSSVGCIQV